MGVASFFNRILQRKPSSEGPDGGFSTTFSGGFQPFRNGQKPTGLFAFFI